MPDTAFVEFKFPYATDREAIQHALNNDIAERWPRGVTATVIMIVPQATEIPANAT